VSFSELENDTLNQAELNEIKINEKNKGHFTRNQFNTVIVGLSCLFCSSSMVIVGFKIYTFDTF
jgi:hypothetical protein